MKPFTYERAASPSEAAAAVARRPGAKFIAGGTNLLDLMKLQIEAPVHLVDVNSLALDKIEPTSDGGLRIGALVRNTALAADERVRRDYGVLSRALLAGASGQLRNQATAVLPVGRGCREAAAARGGRRGAGRVGSRRGRRHRHARRGKLRVGGGLLPLRRSDPVLRAQGSEQVKESIIKAVTGAVAAAVLGWAASTLTTALTLVGRVAAIETGQARIEAQLVQLLSRK